MNAVITLEVINLLFAIFVVLYGIIAIKKIPIGQKAPTYWLVPLLLAIIVKKLYFVVYHVPALLVMNLQLETTSFIILPMLESVVILCVALNFLERRKNTLLISSASTEEMLELRELYKKLNTSIKEIKEAK